MTQLYIVKGRISYVLVQHCACEYCEGHDRDVSDDYSEIIMARTAEDAILIVAEQYDNGNDIDDVKDVDVSKLSAELAPIDICMKALGQPELFTI